MTSEPSPAPVREGDILDGKYRVERVLGIGGMGVVVAARHLQLDQRVAIKFVLPTAMANAEAVERFAREARAAVKLRSEHVARVLDVGRLAHGAPYMVMEYLEGRDLGDVIEQRGQLPPHEAVDYVLQACEAIAEAHALGIVHRDLKPKNMFVTTRVDGRPLVKVLDFGISKSNPIGPGGGHQEMSLTRTSAVMGSPNYMSPEQLRSAKMVDARTDIWALGIILYESLTGRVPFDAETVTQLCAMVLQDTPRPLEEMRNDLPPGLSNVVFACLEKDVARRMPSVAELARALERFAPAASAGVASRIATVAQGGITLKSPNGSPPEDSSSKRVAVTGGTSVAWGETQLAPTTRKRGARGLVLAGIAAVVVVSGLAFFAVRHAATSAAAAPSAELEKFPPTRQIELSPPPPSSVTASLVLPAPAPSASIAEPPSSATLANVPPPPMPTATHRTPLTTPPAARQPGISPPKPKGAHAGDDMPDERN